MRLSEDLNGLIISLGFVAILVLILNSGIAEFGRTSSAGTLTVDEWEQRKRALREERYAYARAATRCRLAMEKRIAEGRVANVDLAQLGGHFNVRLAEIPTAYCFLFVRAIIDDKISFEEFVAWADEPPLDLPGRLAGR
jgi:hypothetical protein